MKKYSLILSMILAVLVSSCSLDPNQDPNNVLAENATPDLRLAAAETLTYAVQASSMNGLGNYWMNAWSGDFAFYGNPATRETNLELNTSFYSSIFTNTYLDVNMFQQIIDSPVAEDYPNYVAISKVLKAFFMQFVVDMYGDVPYSEAFKESEQPFPTYDSDISVYQGLVGELEEAVGMIDQFGGNGNFAVSPESDPIFLGDMDSWKKFANTVLLKYAIHMSNTSNSDGVALRNDILSFLSSNNAQFIDTDVTINPGYDNSSSSKQSPLYNAFGRGTATGTINNGGYRLMTASDHIVKSLEGDPSKITSGVDDPRIGFLFQPAVEYNGVDLSGPVGYYGYVQGQNNDEFKMEYGVPVNGTVKPAIDNVSFKGGPFYSFPDGAFMDGVLMFLSESELLQAEAAVRGYQGFSGGQGHFEDAVTASFTFDGMASDAGAYLSAISSKPQVGWTGSDEDKIAAIQYQRWIALTNFNALETYINYLRTGYPETPLATNTSRSNKPWRLLYPDSEYGANSANVPDVSLDEIFDQNNEHTPFIYK